MAGKTDVIHINIVSSATVSTNGISDAVVSITTVLGNIVAGSVKISAGKIVISSLNFSAGAAISFALSITSDTKLKAGDSITISITSGAKANTDSTKSVHAQIGANAGQELMIGIGNMDSETLGVRATDGTALDISSQTKASGAITLINNAIEKVSTERSKLGAYQNRLEHTINNLGTSSENLTAAESRVRDVDMAKEMMSFQKNNILQQAAQAMLAQANQQPQGVLQLLR
ncbi:hypothetical protein SDC9_165669 [bioreactor metagenome]|uniref:Flagellin C-terminal domain-containing protein n=1 Tax=bioreactor metagenome TaxID=1076179 RepID=A0A645FXF7_9ZZZZ